MKWQQERALRDCKLGIYVFFIKELTLKRNQGTRDKSDVPYTCWVCTQENFKRRIPMLRETFLATTHLVGHDSAHTTSGRP